jgi:hypothetical protein
MSASYNIAGGHEASYYVSPSGNTMVTVQSASPLKFRAVYVGTASLQFMWVSSGKSSHWQFTPSLMDPTPAQFSQDPQGQIISVDIGNRFFPAAGIIKTNATGEISAPAIHFDIPYATDLWVFLLRSPWFPMKVGFEKSPLTISHDSAEATAELQSSVSGIEGEADALKTFVSMHGQGFKKVSLTLKRSVGRESIMETLGELASGAETFTWKPAPANFNTILVANSYMTIGQFLDFLRSMGAETHSSFFTLGNFIANTFMLGDSPAVNYTLQLVGEKGFFGHERDETKITLTPKQY